jgi:hypothetical protein
MSSTTTAETPLKPFILARRIQGGALKDEVAAVRAALADNSFSVHGEYSPEGLPGAASATILICNNDAVRSAAAKSDHGGYALAQRVAVTQIGSEVQVSYVNPLYMAHAYRMEDILGDVASKLQAALADNKKPESFGSAKGLVPKKLRAYHYTVGMEYFNNPYVLGKYDSHEAALAAVEKGLAAQDKVGLLCRMDVEGKKESVFCVSMKAGADGDRHMDDGAQLEVVDFHDLRATAYLPYEIVVSDGRVLALHMRFRMAVMFPDLKMMGAHSFMKLKSSPEAIRKALAAILKAEA